MLYVHAFTLGARPPPVPRSLRGHGGAPVRWKRCHSLLAAVSVLETAPAPEHPALALHDAVVRGLASRCEALLPVRFGQTAADAAALDSLVAPMVAPLTESLSLVKGREQMTLRLFGESRPPPLKLQLPEGAGPGSRYLAQRMAMEKQKHDVPELEPLLSRLEPLIRSQRAHRHDSEGLIATIYHLIDRGQSDAYLAALAEVVLPFKLDARGPFPPYAFAPEPL
jgi:hypothetical protein